MATHDGIGDSVASHYNRLENNTVDQRKESRIFYMRNFNNWIKSMLINEYSNKIKADKQRNNRRDTEDDGYHHNSNNDPNQRFNVLDIGCGKGGDIGKWNKVKPNYFVGVDIAETSVEQAKTRFRERRNNFRADFFAADCTKTDLDPLFKEFCEEQDVTFDIVSCQFAFHYCFESVQQADCMLRNISKRLRKGGFFIGTTTDANDIVSRVRNGTNLNSVYNITSFDPPLSKDEPPSIFGSKYNFQLEGVVDCPEFLVHFPTFEKLAERHGLMLICKQRFDRYFNSKKEDRNGESLLRHMKCLEEFHKGNNHQTMAGGNPNGPQYIHAKQFLESQTEHDMVRTLSKDEWEAITLYLVFAFKKLE